MIPHSRPTIDARDVSAVRRTLLSRQIGIGAEVRRFERDFAKFIGDGDAVAVQSGSAALHLALRALGIRGRDRVAIPSYVCAAVLNAVLYVGAEPVLIDVDPLTANVDLDDLRRKSEGLACAIVPHQFGLPAPIAPIRKLGVRVIEDCAVSVGAKCGALGDVSVFSFYATKMMATGQGGVVASRSADMIRNIRDAVHYDKRENYEIRYNYRMSDLSAALGRAQLKRVSEFVRKRRKIAELYYEGLAGRGVRLPPKEGHVFHRFAIGVRSRADGLIAHMRRRGVECKRPVYRPLHVYLGFDGAQFPGAEQLYGELVSIPIYPSLSPREANRVVNACADFFDRRR